jgi:hypothetical protein
MLQNALLLCTMMGTTIWAPSEEVVIQRTDEVVMVSVQEVETRRHRGSLLIQDVRASISWTSPGGKLKTGQTITIEVLGGEAFGIISHVPGSFRASKGDQALVYLSRHGQTYRPWGLSYGWLPVVSGSDGNQWLQRSLLGLRIVGDGLSGDVEEPWQRAPLSHQLSLISKLRLGRSQ